MAPKRTVHLRIEGRVQGVGYRAWMAEQARSLGVVGWVKNRRDGAVEAVIQGSEATIAELLRRCHEGPHDAAVTRVDLMGEGGGVFDGFAIKPTT